MDELVSFTILAAVALTEIRTENSLLETLAVLLLTATPATVAALVVFLLLGVCLLGRGSLDEFRGEGKRVPDENIFHGLLTHLHMLLAVGVLAALTTTVSAADSLVLKALTIQL